MKHLMRNRMMALALAVLFAVPFAAQAASLDEYRQEGVIAERYDGYVEIRSSNPSAAAAQVVQRVNAERRELYQKRAEQKNVPVAEVGKLFAEKIADQAPPGTYFRL